MSITYPLTLPVTKGIRMVTLMAHYIVGIAASSFTGQQQVYEYPGSFWEAQVELPRMVRADAEVWIAFLLSLHGRSGSFFLGDPAGRTALGTASGVTVNGASQTGNTLAVSGSGTIQAGDYLQLGSGITTRLHKNLTTQALPATLDIFPRLRESPTNGSSVVLASAVGTFRLKDNVTSFAIDVAKTYGITFNAIEAF
jgi:hypothetical protein